MLSIEAKDIQMDKYNTLYCDANSNANGMGKGSEEI
mgnify:CR=1 FL=1